MPYSKLVACKIGELDGRTVWELDEPFQYTNGVIKITIDKGFQCDFCSVPRVPIAYLLVGAIGEEAGLVHDYGYREGAIPKMTRAEVDKLFYNILGECGVSWWKRKAMYYAVRVGAGRNWHKRKVMEPFIQQEVFAL
jgi:hypothetical protein